MSGMSHIGGAGNGGGADSRVDGLIEAHRKAHKSVRDDLRELKAGLDSFAATVTDHLSNHPAPATQEMPAPQVLTHHQDVHHTYIEKISDEEQARIEQALNTAQRAMEQADYAIGQAVMAAQMYERSLEEKSAQIASLELDVSLNAARHSNDLGTTQAMFKAHLNRAYWCFGFGLGVALVLGVYNAL